MNYSVIIPVYNGEKTIPLLVDEIQSFFSSTTHSYEIIFIYDNGQDNSWNTIIELKEKLPTLIKAIKLTRNYGQHNAIICGFEHAVGKYFITIDEDLQHSPKDIQLLINRQKETNSDIVYGSYNELNHNKFRNITSSIIRIVLSNAIEGLHPNYSAFRLLKKGVAMESTKMRNSYTFLDGYLSWITTNVSDIEVSHQKRLIGESGYTVKKLYTHLANILFTFSSFPIKLLTYLSVIIFTITAIYSSYLIVLKFLDINFIKGFPTLIIVTSFGISLILLGLSIIGEYLFRINLKTTKRPNYIVDKIHA
jgi:undecaprenyl-phosphate 4-deoxy-4-formamido-L-arabinose transferase